MDALPATRDLTKRQPSVGYDAPLVAVALGLAAGAAFALQRANYVVFSFAIRLTAVLLLDLAQGAPLANAVHRIEATVVGGLVALGFA